MWKSTSSFRSSIFLPTSNNAMWNTPLTIFGDVLERMESQWFQSNSESTGTKEMGPGGRHDTLDDTFDQANYKKCVSMGKHNFQSISLHF
jgi:hypothetical protein